MHVSKEKLEEFRKEGSERKRGEKGGEAKSYEDVRGLGYKAHLTCYFQSGVANSCRN